MRKLLTIVVIFVLLFALAILSTPHIMSVFNLDKKISDYIVSKLTKEGEELLTIDDVDFRFGRIKLSGIEFINNTSNVDFIISGLQFDYSMFKLLRNIDSPHKSINKVFLVQPKVIFKEMSTTTSSQPDTPDTSKTNIIDLLNQFENIDKIHLKEGEIIFHKSSGHSVIVAQNLNGWINSDDFSSIKIQAAGKLFDARSRNFVITSNLNLSTQCISAHVQINNFNLKNTNLIYVNDDLRVDHGFITSHLDISSNNFSLDSVQISGSLTFRDLSVIFFNSEIKKLNLTAKISENLLKIDSGQGIFEDSEFKLYAQIDDILKPQLSGTLESKEFKLKPFANLLDIKEIQNLTIEMESDFKITPSDYTFDFKLHAPRIPYKAQILKNIFADLKIENDHFTINKLTFNVFDIDIASRGQFNIDSGVFQGTLFGEREVGNHIFFDRIAGATQYTRLELKGNIINKTLDGLWSTQVVKSLDTLISFSGRMQINNGIFAFSKNSTGNNDFLFSIEVADIFGNPTVNFGYIVNPPIRLLTNNNWLIDFIKNYRIEGIAAGPINSLNSQILIQKISNPKSRLLFTSEIKDILKSEKNFIGKLAFNRFQGMYNFTVGNQHLYGNLTSNGELRGEFDINLSREEQIKSNITISKFNFGLFYPDSITQDNGDLSGQVDIGGNLDCPKLSAVFNGDRFIFNNIGYYSFDLSISADTNYIRIDTANIALNNVAVLSGDLLIDLLHNKINALASGQNVDSDYIFQTLFGKKDFVTGSGDYNMEVKGYLTSPNIYVDLELRDGELDDINFDRVQISLKDSLIKGSQYLEHKNHLINIRNFVAIKGGQYHLEGHGNLPLYDDGQIDLNVNFDGDILSFIPKWDSFFIDGASFASINVKIAGTPSKPRLIEGLAQIERGELWLREVVEHIENISGTIEIEQETNRVLLKKVRGDIEGKSLVINTVHDIVTSDGKKLAPWYFKDLDLDFGILSMKTPLGGIKLNIPKLMPDGEYGTLALTGKSSSENFYFAGPVDEPHAWGAVTFANSRFTFPFPEGEGGKPGKVIRFLKDIYWDVYVKAGKDLHYVKAIPAFLDEVDTELSIDPRSQGLIFNGIIAKNTFKPVGEMHSSRGRLDYLDLNFRVESFGAIFNKVEDTPEVYGRAMTTVRDSIGASSKTIYLQLFALDRETGQEIRRARWEDFRFQLVSADPTIGESQEQVLAYLGYSVDNIKEKATEVGGAVTENYVIRPLLRPLEKQLERYLGFDLVRFNSRIAKNLFLASLGDMPDYANLYDRTLFYDTISPYAVLFESSEVTVGKYLSRDLYLFYTGKLVAIANQTQGEFNLNHSLGLEYRFYQNLLLEFEYDREIMKYYHLYPGKPYLEDFKIRLRHSFSF